MRRLVQVALAAGLLLAGVAGVELQPVRVPGIPAAIVVPALSIPEASAQYVLRGTRKGTWQDVSCGASSGSPTQIAPRRADRVSFAIVNDSAAGVYIGGDTGTTALTGTNGILLPAGQSLNDSLPGVFIGELRCQSSDTTARTVRVLEVRQ